MKYWSFHYNDVIMDTIASQITSLTIVYSTVYSGADQRKHQSSASLAFVWGIHRGPHKWPVTRKMFPFDDVIMLCDEDNSRRRISLTQDQFVQRGFWAVGQQMIWYALMPTCGEGFGFFNILLQMISKRFSLIRRNFFKVDIEISRDTAGFGR